MKELKGIFPNWFEKVPFLKKYKVLFKQTKIGSYIPYIKQDFIVT
jgi:hypothetical protein